MGHSGAVGQVGGGSVVTVLMAPARLLPLPLLVLVALLTVLVAGEPVVAAGARGPLAAICQVVAATPASAVFPEAPAPTTDSAPVPAAPGANLPAPVFPRHRSQAPPSAMMCAIHHHPEPSEGIHATSYHPHHRHPGGLPHL